MYTLRLFLLVILLSTCGNKAFSQVECSNTLETFSQLDDDAPKIDIKNTSNIYKTEESIEIDSVSATVRIIMDRNYSIMKFYPLILKGYKEDSLKYNYMAQETVLMINYYDYTEYHKFAGYPEYISKFLPLIGKGVKELRFEIIRDNKCFEYLNFVTSIQMKIKKEL